MKKKALDVERRLGIGINPSGGTNQHLSKCQDDYKGVFESAPMAAELCTVIFLVILCQLPVHQVVLSNGAL